MYSINVFRIYTEIVPQLFWAHKLSWLCWMWGFKSTILREVTACNPTEFQKVIFYLITRHYILEDGRPTLHGDRCENLKTNMPILYVAVIQRSFCRFEKNSNPNSKVILSAVVSPEVQLNYMALHPRRHHSSFDHFLFSDTCKNFHHGAIVTFSIWHSVVICFYSVFVHLFFTETHENITEY